jgi:hypothetical protein
LIINIYLSFLQIFIDNRSVFYGITHLMAEYVTHPLRMPAALLQRIEQEAQQQSISLNEFMAYILNLHISQLESERQKPMFSTASADEPDEAGDWTIPIPITLDQFISGAIKRHQDEADSDGDDETATPNVSEISIKEQAKEIIERGEQHSRQ